MYSNYEQQNVTKITLYSDSCFGQNKNSHVCAMFFTALQKFPNISTIDHKFLVPGHTHMECDVDHSIIERLKKKTAVHIHHPRDWLQLVRSAGTRFHVHEMKQTDFLDFAQLYRTIFVKRKKNQQNEIFQWKDTQWLRYQKPIGILLYKNCITDTILLKLILLGEVLKLQIILFFL